MRKKATWRITVGVGAVAALSAMVPAAEHLAASAATPPAAST